jgi:hypothetical protein
MQNPRYIKAKVEHYLLFMFSPPKISWVISIIKLICLHLLPVFYLIQPSSKQFICFYFRKQNNVLPIVFYVPWQIIAGFYFDEKSIRYKFYVGVNSGTLEPESFSQT